MKGSVPLTVPFTKLKADLLLRRARLVTLAGEAGWGLVEEGALAVRDGDIVWAGPGKDLPAGEAARELDLEGALVTPGLVDCHTHLVYAGNRYDEFERRLEGASYEDIARAGGGIAATVRATRAASEAALLAESRPRFDSLCAEGVTTIEIKSGYGLERDTEERMLRVARRLGADSGRTVCTTFLGAHALPPEFAGRADDYIDHLAADVLPPLAAEGLVDAVDAFCETIGFTPSQVARLFGAAASLGIPVKLHAEQLSDQGGAALAARFRGLSADHLEWLSPAGVGAMANAGTVAVLLPGAFHFLRETRVPPVEALRAAGVPMAVATDCNPGTSPLASILAAMSLACTHFRPTPAAALRGATHAGAAALGLGARGRLVPGQRADLAVWSMDHPAGLAANLGFNALAGTFIAGKECHDLRTASR